MTPGQKDILPRFTIILFLMALMAVAVIVKAAFIMFAERGYWEEVADRFVKENVVVMESPPIPTVDEVKKAAVIFKNFCNSRNSNPETDCIECPIRDMCSSDPYTWEV